MSEILLTFSDVARKADVCRKTLYRWKRNGRFNVIPHNNSQPPRWHVDDIAKWLSPVGNIGDDQPHVNGG